MANPILNETATDHRAGTKRINKKPTPSIPQA